MRSRRLSKKLLLNKKTISNLEAHQLGKLKGGAPPSFYICQTNEEYCTQTTCDPYYCVATSPCY